MNTMTLADKKKLLKPTGRQFSSVAEMARSRGDEPLATELEVRQQEQELVDLLVAKRLLRTMTQTDVASAMGCTQGRISKLEASNDRDLTLGDIDDYAKAIGCDYQLLFMKKETTLTDQVMMHAYIIDELLEKLSGLAKNDQAIIAGLKNFYSEAMINFINMVASQSNKLTRKASHVPHDFVIDTEELKYHSRETIKA